MEQLQWPPAGPMGPIMSEYLYVKFFKTGVTQREDKLFWLPEKFQELLMQIRYYVVSDAKLIKTNSPYKDWMEPPNDEIINQKCTNKTAVLIQPSIKESENEPEVFISYQWDKQPQIKRLFKKLTEMGYNCWLDIRQMGGGDSLFNKIDKGIRGAKVILTCVTKKYALRANCRREVALSGALGKPIIPLLMEEIKWPPEGPMSMIFAQLQYIDLSKTEDGIFWSNSILRQIEEKLLNIIPDKIKFIEEVKKLEEMHIKEEQQKQREIDSIIEEGQRLIEIEREICLEKQEIEEKVALEREQTRLEGEKIIEEQNQLIEAELKRKEHEQEKRKFEKKKSEENRKVAQEQEKSDQIRSEEREAEKYTEYKNKEEKSNQIKVEERKENLKSSTCSFL